MCRTPTRSRRGGRGHGCSRGLFEMGAAGDGFGVGALGEEAAFFCAEALLTDRMGGVLFGAADPVARLVVGEAGEDVDVLCVDGDNKDVDAVAAELLCDCVRDEL